jgi:CBS domain-containing protein
MSDVKDVLYAKSQDIFTIDEHKSVADAIHQMMENRIGSLIVTSDDEPAGMFTERDVLRVWDQRADECKFTEVKVGDCMSTNLIAVGPNDDIEYIMSVMIKNRIRHLPVVQDKKVVSMISIRDIVRSQVKNLQVENHYLKEYISGKYS